MVQLHLNGKTKKDIIREYDLTPSSLDKWVNQIQTPGSFKEKDNLPPEEQELTKLRKEIRQLQMRASVDDMTSEFIDIFQASRQNIMAYAKSK